MPVIQFKAPRPGPRRLFHVIELESFHFLSPLRIDSNRISAASVRFALSPDNLVRQAILEAPERLESHRTLPKGRARASAIAPAPLGL